MLILKVEFVKIHLIDPDDRYYLIQYYMCDNFTIDSDWTVLYDSLSKELIPHEYHSDDESKKLFIDLEGHSVYKASPSEYKNDRIFFNYMNSVGEETLIKELERHLVEIQL